MWPVRTPLESSLKRAAGDSRMCLRRPCHGKASRHMSEARTPDEETIESDLSSVPDEDVPVDDEYDGPDPEDDPKGDASDEDQGT